MKGTELEKLARCAQLTGEAVMRELRPLHDKTRELALVHVGDGDELGVLAREILARLDQMGIR